MPKGNRSLYQCFNARVLIDKIYCAAGYRLTQVSVDGTININRLIRGTPLELTIC